ncbi:putative holin-like toxin [Apilactobacillus quenuiae]|nr:putative holin-like toxin [Apilactobacillus quenuiae]
MFGMFILALLTYINRK